MTYRTKTTKLILSIATATIAISALAGCVQTPAAQAPTPTVSATPAPTATVKPTAAPAPLVGDTNGDGKLSEHEKQVAAMFAVRDYTLADGTTVTVDPAQPLPDSVRADVAQAATPGIATSGIAGNTAELRAALKVKSDLTGRVIIAVYEDQPGQWVGVASNGTGGLFNAVSTRDEAVALATAYGQNQRNFDIITL